MELVGHLPSIGTKGARRDWCHIGGIMPLLSFRVKCKKPVRKRFAVSSAFRRRNGRSENREAMLILTTGSGRKEMYSFRFQRGNHSTTPVLEDVLGQSSWQRGNCALQENSRNQVAFQTCDRASPEY